jgi:hypothetical protein
MKQPTKIEYNEALRNYFYKTRGHVTHVVHKVEVEYNTIMEYDKYNVPLSKSEIVIKACMFFLGRFLATIVFCILIIFVLNEVFGVVVSYSITNILLLISAFFAYKIKFRLWREDKV